VRPCPGGPGGIGGTAPDLSGSGPPGERDRHDPLQEGRTDQGVPPPGQRPDPAREEAPQGQPALLRVHRAPGLAAGLPCRAPFLLPAQGAAAPAARRGGVRDPRGVCLSQPLHEQPANLALALPFPPLCGENPGPLASDGRLPPPGHLPGPPAHVSQGPGLSPQGRGTVPCAGRRLGPGRHPVLHGLHGPRGGTAGGRDPQSGAVPSGTGEVAHHRGTFPHAPGSWLATTLPRGSAV